MGSARGWSVDMELVGTSTWRSKTAGGEDVGTEAPAVEGSSPENAQACPGATGP